MGTWGVIKGRQFSLNLGYKLLKAEIKLKLELGI